MIFYLFSYTQYLRTNVVLRETAILAAAGPTNMEFEIFRLLLK